jgi:hypothetical protein
MAQSIAQRVRYTDQSQSSISAVCETRIDLLDRLAGILVSLSCATFELTSAGRNGDTVSYEFAQFEVERLRNDCNSIRLELECHRAQHGC